MMPEASGASCGANACGFSRKKTSATVSPSAGVRPATYTKDFTRTLAVAEMTAPAYACAARTTGPLVRSSNRSSALTSSLRDVRGIGAASTLNPSACRGRMTPFQLEPSAHAPWTTTIVISLVRSGRPDRGFISPKKDSSHATGTDAMSDPSQQHADHVRALVAPERAPDGATALLAKRCHPGGPDGLGRRPLLVRGRASLRASRAVVRAGRSHRVHRYDTPPAATPSDRADRRGQRWSWRRRPADLRDRYRAVADRGRRGTGHVRRGLTQRTGGDQRSGSRISDPGGDVVRAGRYEQDRSPVGWAHWRRDRPRGRCGVRAELGVRPRGRCHRDRSSRRDVVNHE